MTHENEISNIKIKIGFEICKILENNNIKHFVDYGSLLGLYRNNKIIENDYDFDIMAIFDKEFDVFNNFKDLIKKYKLQISTRQFGCNIIFIYGDFVFEIYRCSIKNKRYFPIALPKCEMPLFFIDELEKLYIDKEIYFNTPRHKEKYLEHRYGKDYIIPCSIAPNGSKWCDIDYNIIEIKNIYTAYTYGVYDMFHIGHLNLFKRIKNNFDKLIVGIHNDEQVTTYKEKPVIPYHNRLEIIKSCKYIDEIIENAPLIVTDEILNNFNCDYVVAGIENENYINEYYQVSKNNLHLIERTKNISTSQLKKSFQKI